MSTLVIYYSQARGNTKRIAEMIQEKLNCDIERIDTQVPYSDDYKIVVDQGQDEVNKGYKPEIKALNKNIEDYDKIIIGTPTWWYTMAPAMNTFLSSNNFENKNVILFQTHGGWAGHAIKDMEKLCNGANIKSSYQVQFDSEGGDNLITLIEDIEKWIDSLNE